MLHEDVLIAKKLKIRIINFFRPHYKFYGDDDYPQWRKHWHQDPLDSSTYTTPHNFLQTLKNNDEAKLIDLN